MYVMKTCPYCAHVMKQVVGNPHFKVIDIGEDVHDMKEKATGDVCIPCYVREDGSVTLSSKDVGLEPLA